MVNVNKIAEGSFAVISGQSLSVLEQLRREGVYSSSRIIGFSPSNFSNVRDIFVMYYTGGRKILANLLTWYEFNSRDNTTIYDLSDQNNMATLMSGASISGAGVDGVLSGALNLYLSGSLATQLFSGQHVLMSKHDMFRTQAGTIAAWIYRTGVVTSGAVYADGCTIFCMSKYGDAAADSYHAKFQVASGGTIQYSFRNRATAAGDYFFKISGTTYLAMKSWHHVAVTSDGSTVKLYVNGTRQPSDYVGNNIGQWIGALATSGTWIATIGCSTIGGVYSGFFEGKIDNLRVYPYALSEQEIRELYLNQM